MGFFSSSSFCFFFFFLFGKGKGVVVRDNVVPIFEKKLGTFFIVWNQHADFSLGYLESLVLLFVSTELLHYFIRLFYKILLQKPLPFCFFIFILVFSPLSQFFLFS